MDFDTQQTLKNDGGNVSFLPERVYRPESVSQMQAIIRLAEKEGVRVRAIGSLHSWSDAAATEGFAMLPNGLNKTLSLDHSVLKDEVDTETLVAVQSGIRLRELNAWLSEQGLGLPNMGGYDEQTVAGATSTSTHGSGLQFGPMTDMIQTIEIVANNGMLYRIEPGAGITDPAKYARKYPEWNLVQADDWFNSVVVGMGCMGVIYSFILRVREKYWLKEVRELSVWDKVKEDLIAGDVLRNNRHWEVVFNPHKVKGEHLCLITTRNLTHQLRDLPPDKKQRNLIPEFGASLPFVWRIVGWIFRLLPKLSPRIVNFVLKGLADDGYTNVSYKVLNIGTANKVKALSSEIALPLEGNLYIEAIEKFMAMVQQNEAVGKYHTAPVALRFVKGSNAFLSPQQGDTCMMEIIFVKDSRGAAEMMGAYEQELYSYSGRPHMGQFNVLTPDQAAAMYPNFGAWMNVCKKLNANGTFRNAFSDRAFGTSTGAFQMDALQIAEVKCATIISGQT